MRGVLKSVHGGCTSEHVGVNGEAFPAERVNNLEEYIMSCLSFISLFHVQQKTVLILIIIICTAMSRHDLNCQLVPFWTNSWSFPGGADSPTYWGFHIRRKAC